MGKHFGWPKNQNDMYNLIYSLGYYFWNPFFANNDNFCIKTILPFY